MERIAGFRTIHEIFFFALPSFSSVEEMERRSESASNADFEDPMIRICFVSGEASNGIEFARSIEWIIFPWNPLFGKLGMYGVDVNPVAIINFFVVNSSSPFSILIPHCWEGRREILVTFDLTRIRSFNVFPENFSEEAKSLR